METALEELVCRASSSTRGQQIGSHSTLRKNLGYILFLTPFRLHLKTNTLSANHSAGVQRILAGEPSREDLLKFKQSFNYEEVGDRSNIVKVVNMVVGWSLISPRRGMAKFGRKTLHSQNNHLLLYQLEIRQSDIWIGYRI